MLLVETSNPGGGVTVKLPVRLLPETVKLVGLAVAVPYVVLTAVKVPLVEIVGVAAETGAKATPLRIVPVPAVYSVLLSAVVMLIVELWPAVSVSLITLLLVVAPLPVVTKRSAPLPFFLAHKPNPPNEVVYVPFVVQLPLTKEYL
ncbi:MAG: hypothetical protein EBZ07_06755 [Verrucomicrobia bacterium]|nr:hypothetical protein [Verrucomicrobiota bacterium]